MYQGDKCNLWLECNFNLFDWNFANRLYSHYWSWQYLYYTFMLLNLLIYHFVELLLLLWHLNELEICVQPYCPSGKFAWDSFCSTYVVRTLNLQCMRWFFSLIPRSSNTDAFRWSPIAPLRIRITKSATWKRPGFITWSLGPVPKSCFNFVIYVAYSQINVFTLITKQ